MVYVQKDSLGDNINSHSYSHSHSHSHSHSDGRNSNSNSSSNILPPPKPLSPRARLVHLEERKVRSLARIARWQARLALQQQTPLLLVVVTSSSGDEDESKRRELDAEERARDVSERLDEEEAMSRHMEEAVSGLRVRVEG